MSVKILNLKQTMKVTTPTVLTKTKFQNMPLKQVYQLVDLCFDTTFSIIVLLLLLEEASIRRNHLPLEGN